MKVLSIQTSKIKTVSWKNKDVTTGHFKDPVEGPVEVKGFNIIGDEQAETEVHGGQYKAIYSYASEHYNYWKQNYERPDWPYGIFGENLTTQGLDESQINVGDRFRIGTVLLEAAQPRMPCSKLGIRFENPGMIKQFLEARRPGIYYQVIEEGQFQAGDEIIQEFKHPEGIKIFDIMDLLAKRPQDKSLVQKIAGLEINQDRIIRKAKEALEKN